MKLREIQKQFTRNLLQESDGQSNHFYDFFEAGEIAANDRFGVYRNNILGSLTNVLRTAYPATEKLVGPDFMRVMARSFIRSNLPRFACLNEYGGDFAAFIAGYAPAAKLPWLPDVARLEWSLHSAACAPDDEPLDPGFLRNVSPGTLASGSFSLRRSCRLVSASWPVDEIHAFAIADGSGNPPDISPGPAWFLVTRPALDTTLCRLDADEYAFLEALSSGQTLQAASENHLGPDPQTRLAALLERHFRRQTFATFFNPFPLPKRK